MLKELSIKNFQSHKDTRIGFTDGLNVIVGKSDCGKSAILRALRWVIYSQPSGDAFRSDWGGDTVVGIKLTTGDEIRRVKTKSENYYLLNDSRFDALAGKVPAEIQAVLKMDEINLQSQFDQPFLLSSTSGAVASHFNGIAKIEQIEISTKLIKKDISDTKNIIEAAKDQLADFGEQVKQYEDLPKFEADLEVLEEEQNNLNKASKSLKKAKELVNSYTDAVKVEKSLKGVLKLSRDFDNLTVLREVHTTNVLEHEKLTETLNRYFKLSEIESKAVSLIKLSSPLISIQKDIERGCKQRKTFSNAVQLLEQYTVAQKTGEILEKQLINDTRELKANMPERCPLCNSKTK